MTVASTDEIDLQRGLASEFMFAVFELEPGDYLVTDESDLLDFVPLDEPDAQQAWHRIEQAFGVDLAAVGSSRLTRILDAIAARRRIQ